MAIKTYCDRCDIEIEEYTGYTKIPNGNIRFSQDMGHESYHFCPTCKALAERWKRLIQIKIQKIFKRYEKWLKFKNKDKVGE